MNKFRLKFKIKHISALIQITARCRTGDKPLPQPVLFSSLTLICVTLPQWVNCLESVNKPYVIPFPNAIDDHTYARLLTINLLWLIDAIWLHRYWWILVQVIVCFLTVVPSHFLSNDGVISTGYRGTNWSEFFIRIHPRIFFQEMPLESSSNFSPFHLLTALSAWFLCYGDPAFPTTSLASERWVIRWYTG